MELSTLQTFLAVVRQGSFAAVARDLHVDPSSVSRAIASLEKELGIRLFQRTTRQLSLTESGAIYYERMEPIVEDMEQAISAATELSSQPRGTLRVTASVAFGLSCIVPLLPEFEAAYPELSLDLVLSDAVLDLVGDRIDVAIRLGVLSDSSAIAHRLMKTRYLVCASPDYVAKHGWLRKPEDLAKRNCLRFPLPGFRSQWQFKGEDGNVEVVAVQGKMTISNAIALKNCVLASMGISLLPDWLVRFEIESGALLDLFPGYEVAANSFNTAAWFVYPSNRYLPLKVKVFTTFLKQRLETTEKNSPA